MKFTMVFALIGLFLSAFFMTHVPLSDTYSGISAIAVVIFALPTVIAVIKTLGIKRGGLLLLVLAVYSLVVETVALRTGFPYGEFVYAGKIGSKLMGVTPWTVAFAWPPLVIGAYAAATRITTKPLLTILYSLFFLLLTDAVIDPGSVSLGFWKYVHGGLYYGVPLSNFLGWTLTSLVGSGVLYAYTRKHKKLPLSFSISLFYIVAFWTYICFWNSLVVPALCGVTFVIMMICISHFQKQPLR